MRTRSDWRSRDALVSSCMICKEASAVKIPRTRRICVQDAKTHGGCRPASFPCRMTTSKTLQVRVTNDFTAESVTSPPSLPNCLFSRFVEDSGKTQGACTYTLDARNSRMCPQSDGAKVPVDSRYKTATQGRLRPFAAAAVLGPTFTSGGSARATATLGEPRERGYCGANWSSSTRRERRAEHRLRGEAR